ncbi:peptidoglycan-binding domain-containing protein [Embleya sp. AB8]|uniref:peptidoglycan-binding domain-containing protein n=1 Tax=Embleya sp. AB8 TaxID=3156304 RepID=UPI003C737F92
MASKTLTKALLGTLTAAALSIGTLAGATTAGAAPAAEQVPTARSVSIQAVNNLGLNTGEGKRVQCFVRSAGYDPGTIDGRLGSNSWKAWQSFLNDGGYGAGAVDGSVGPNTIRALQRYLVALGSDTGGIDGVAGRKTRAAWKGLANARDWCNQ